MSSPRSEAEAFGRELKHWRENRQMKQADVAGRINVARATLSQWETGRHLPSAENIAELDRLLDTQGELLRAAEGAHRAPVEPLHRISLHEVYRRLGCVLVDNLVRDDDGVMLGWRREFRSDLPVSGFSTVCAIRVLCVLPNAPYIDNIDLLRLAERFHEKGGWATRLVGVRPETSAVAIDVLARLGSPDLDRYLSELEVLLDTPPTTSTYVLAEALGVVARLRPESALCERLVRKLLDARAPTGRELWPEKAPNVSGVVPEASTAHTARALTALLQAKEADVDDNGEIARAIDVGATWLVREGRLDLMIRENLEPFVPGQGTRDLEIRHATPALVARALALAPDGVPWSVIQNALDQVWRLYNPGIGRWVWPNGDVPIWLQFDAVSAILTAAERSTFAVLSHSAGQSS